MTTSINLINEIDSEELYADEDEDDLPTVILDMSRSHIVRLNALEKYYETVGEEAVEIVKRICGMYQFSGSKIIENFLVEISYSCALPSIIRLEGAKNLLMFETQLEEAESEEEKNMDENIRSIKKANETRKKKGYDALNVICNNIKEEVPTPCRLEAIFILMRSEWHQDNSIGYFCDVITDKSIDDGYRYKTILSLDNKEDIESRLKFKKLALVAFVKNENSNKLYRIMASQQLMTHGDSEMISIAEKTLSDFASDKELDYNLRADAADTLLKSKSPALVEFAQNIIMQLGDAKGTARTMFDNAQNIHTSSVDDAVTEALEFLSKIPYLYVDNNPITLEYVSAQIRKLLESRVDNQEDYRQTLEPDMGEYQVQNIKSSDKFSGNRSAKRILLALKRISMDRVMYSKYNNTLENILLKVWSYIEDHEHSEEMRKRLLEELEEMAGTCSSGFAGRLINTISGFGDFNIKMTWEDQIIGNLTGRLNAKAREITDPLLSPFFEEPKINDVVELYFKSNPSALEEAKNLLVSEGEKITYNHTMKKITESYLSVDRTERIKRCVEQFYDDVLEQMTLPSIMFDKRQSFLLFFRTHLSHIRQEMYGEFKELISDSDFDLYFRKAIISYEGA